ncbi:MULTISPECIES: cytochrome c [unclassified Tatumella]|uniref:cytochrome c n=1 Tax=unclassified Tatumella TaxID=2649542 RepID=UPI0032C43D80
MKYQKAIHAKKAAGFRRTLLSVCLGVSALGALPAFAAEQVPVSQPAVDNSADALLKQGHYLAIAADCAACHTDPETKKTFAGGYAIHSPMGIIYSTNITPSKQYGIGNYTEAQFEQAVRHGIRADGSHLYPAMPYTSYAGLTDKDVHALYYYFTHAVQPVEQANRPTNLGFPFNIRQAMWGWNLLFLNQKPYRDDPSQSADWNRGKYLVANLEHCGECHTPRNIMMGTETGNAEYSGAALGSWYAPNLTSDRLSGLGSWQRDQLMTYLKTGHVTGKAQAAGPMAEAITNSLQYLDDKDIGAIVTYLQSLPAVSQPHQAKPTGDFGTSAGANPDSAVRGTQPMGSALPEDMSGEALYDTTCASCHQSSGAGTEDHFYPSLFNNTATGGNTPNNLVSAILFGVQREVKGKQVLMPAFGPGSDVQSLNDQQVAKLSNYIFKQFGNPQLSVTADQVKTLREGGAQPFLAKYAAAGSVAGGIILLLIIILIIVRVSRKRR